MKTKNLFILSLCSCLLAGCTSSKTSQLNNAQSLDSETIKVNSGTKNIKDLNSNNFTKNTKNKKAHSIPVVIPKEHYTVLKTNIPNFDISPIDFEDIYISKVDGLYGFIDNNGVWKVDPSYKKVDVFLQEENRACAFNYEERSALNEGVDIQGNTCRPFVGGGRVGSISYIDDNNTLQIKSLEDQEITPSKKGKDCFKVYKFSSSEQVDFTSTGPYYIYSQATKQVFGPYDEDEAPTFIFKNFQHDENIFIVHSSIVGVNTMVQGLFYEKTDKGYVIYSEDGTLYTDTAFDTAEVISNNAIKVSLNGKVGIINEDLELVLFGDFEDVSNIINDHAYVKKDGHWMLIQIS